MNQKKKIGARVWSVLMIFGLIGQLAWSIENMYFNVFVYKTITDDPSVTAAMVAASAVTATLTTLLVGAWSDKVGKRRSFMAWGYILWGFSTLAFGFVTVENAAALFPAANAVHMASLMVILLDCVMTVFGSTANDAAFNAWVTDTVDSDNRGKVESVLATLPLVAMLIIFGGFDSFTQRGEWKLFFMIFGVMVTLCGIAGLFLVKDSSALKPAPGKYMGNLVYGLRPSVAKANKQLYLTLLAMLVFCSAVQVFMPYLIVYIQYFLGINDYAIVLGIVLIAASAASVLGGRLIDKIGKMRFLLISLPIMLVGLVLMSIARSMVFVTVSGIVMMSGYMLATAVISAMVRDNTPPEKSGHFQGIRMFAMVALPMIIGPFVGSAVIKGSNSTYVDLGVEKLVPNSNIFLASAAMLLLIIPVLILMKKEGRK